MASIYDLSWNETSFLSKLQLFLKSRKQNGEKILSDDCCAQAEGYSALSSTYYSIVGTAFSQLKAGFQQKLIAPVRIVAWCITWLPLSVWCYWRMLLLSNRVVDLVGYKNMTADQCDIRQSILRRRGQYKEAEKCICIALVKNPLKAHTRGLLRVGLAEIYQKWGLLQNAREQGLAAIRAAEETEGQDPRQAARIYRNCANLFEIGGNGNYSATDLRRKAQELAKSINASDQILKL